MDRFPQSSYPFLTPFLRDLYREFTCFCSWMVDRFRKGFIPGSSGSGVAVDITNAGFRLETGTEEMQPPTWALGLDVVGRRTFVHVTIDFILCTDEPIVSAPGNVPGRLVLPGAGGLMEIFFDPFFRFRGGAFNFRLEYSRVKVAPLGYDGFKSDLHAYTFIL